MKSCFDEPTPPPFDRVAFEAEIKSLSDEQFAARLKPFEDELAHLETVTLPWGKPVAQIEEWTWHIDRLRAARTA